MSTPRGLAIACAIALGMILPPLAPAELAAAEDSASSEIAISGNAAAEGANNNTTPIDAADFSGFLDPADTPADTDLSDPQPLAFSLAGEDDDRAGPPRRWTDPNLAMARPDELANSPMAPLPPAIVAGPIGIAFAAYFAWRAKHRM